MDAPVWRAVEQVMGLPISVALRGRHAGSPRGVAAWSDAMRAQLVEDLAPLVERDESGEAVVGEGERSRFSGAKDVSFVRLRPERVLEVRYDQLEGARFRHTVQFERWRPDRDARSCTYEQLDTVAGYDLADVLA